VGDGDLLGLGLGLRKSRRAEQERGANQQGDTVRLGDHAGETTPEVATFQNGPARTSESMDVGTSGKSEGRSGVHPRGDGKYGQSSEATGDRGAT